MESFLKDRPVHSVAGAAASPVSREPAASDLPFAPIQRAVPATNAAPARVPTEIEAGRSADGASVRAIMENGRITRLVVTCSCGKVTEIACAY
ncbi:hypothetical protein ASA1KI_09850 [Opitutales bacterium ASA1]|uniref:hypothetical protein n=1 Tax=Congregicoccus parvus TaxID=3081749 RepID=UPI002B2A1299|nr:hypothetical protein ASA1KI_09850 [Opitutales bacterium ASA1]